MYTPPVATFKTVRVAMHGKLGQRYFHNHKRRTTAVRYDELGTLSGIGLQPFLRPQYHHVRAQMMDSMRYGRMDFFSSRFHGTHTFVRNIVNDAILNSTYVEDGR